MDILYIVPANSDISGQCRIVARKASAPLSARDNYREAPELWREAGLMNSRGKVVCLDAPADQYQELRDCEPLVAGTQFVFEEARA